MTKRLMRSKDLIAQLQKINKPDRFMVIEIWLKDGSVYQAFIDEIFAPETRGRIYLIGKGERIKEPD